MKAFLFMSAALLGIAGISTHADAENYPWCGYYKEDVNCVWRVNLGENGGGRQSDEALERAKQPACSAEILAAGAAARRRRGAALAIGKAIGRIYQSRRPAPLAASWAADSEST